MTNSWQTPAALGLVGLTVLIFIFRIVRRRKNPAGGCGGGCACPVKPESR